MKIIDKYIIRNFLGTFLMTELVILVLAVVVDMVEKIDKFLVNDASIGEITEYYLNFMLYYGNMYMSLVVFLAATIFTSKFAGRSEVIAIQSSGVDYNRFLRPYLYAAVFLMSISLVVNNFILPASNVKRLAFEDKFVKQKNISDQYIQNILKQVGEREIIYIGEWNITTNSGSKFAFERYDSIGRLVHKFKADYISYNIDSARYSISTYYSRDLHEDGTETISNGYTKDTVFAFTPADFSMDARIGDKKNSVELAKLIKLEEKRGSPNVKVLVTEKYKRFAMPFATLILTVLAVSLSSRKKRGGAGINIAVGIVLMAVYLFMLRIFETMASQGNSGFPLFWMWLPNIIFTVIAYLLYRNAKK